MAVLSGAAIKTAHIITPFHPRTEVEYGSRKFTYGVGPAGYDVRAEFEPGQVQWMLAPGEFRLASTIERFVMPKDVLGEVKDKSSWARRGLAVQNTVIEPGWRGHLTLELTNHSQQWITITEGMPIAQIIFHWIVGEVTPYNGKYQDQERGPQDAR